MKSYLLLIISVFLFASCNMLDNYGKKLEFGKSEVYYKGDGVKESDAQKLGDYLSEQGWLKGDRKSYQLTYDGEDYLVHSVINKEKLTDALKLSFWKLQYDIAKNVFKDKARLVLADDHFKDIEVLNPVNNYSIGESNIYYDNSAIKKSEVKSLADFLTDIKLLAEDKGADVFYQKEDGMPVVRIIVNAEKMTDQVLPVFTYWGEQMKEKVFNGKKIKLILTSTTYEDLDPLPKLTAEQREQFQNEENNTTTTNSLDSALTQTKVSGIERLKD